ncbi:unnamed protein product [Dicrocoelium dendriticum]|nr:unnamed protein product [Dicrocoelium dendriticum]
MLEAKTHAMVDQLLLKASENATQGSSSTTARSSADFTRIFHPRSHSARETNSTSQFELKANGIPAKPNEVMPALEQAGECPKPVASPTLLWANLENRSLSCTIQSTVEDNMLLRLHFLVWRQTVVATRIQVATFAKRRHCRLKRSAFRSWRSLSVVARLESELEKTK